VKDLEHWLFPPAPAHLDSPRASLRVICEPKVVQDQSSLLSLSVGFQIFRPRTGEKTKTLAEVIDLTSRSAHEQELFSPRDWDFIQWLAEAHPDPEHLWDTLV